MKSICLSGAQVVPSKIVCIGRNYVDHIKELQNEVPDEPVLFLKPNSSIASDLALDARDAIHFESEITFVVQSGQLAGVGFGLDLTKREVQSALKAKGLPWERAKAFANAAVFSDFVSFNNLADLRLELRINDTVVQQGGYELMLHKPEKLLPEIDRIFALEDGDLLMTGTPEGVGALKRGDRFQGKIFEGDRLLVEAFWNVR